MNYSWRDLACYSSMLSQQRQTTVKSRSIDFKAPAALAELKRSGLTNEMSDRSSEAFGGNSGHLQSGRNFAIQEYRGPGLVVIERTSTIAAEPKAVGRVQASRTILEAAGTGYRS